MQELLQEEKEQRPEYLDWMASLQSRVKKLEREERMERRIQALEAP